MRARRRAPQLALLALLSLLAAASAAAEPPAVLQGPLTLETLMQRMAATSGVRAEFREEKTLALLEAPLVSEGTLYFIPPARMARITTRPGASRLVIDGERMSYTDETGASDVDLAGNRVARSIVENFVVLFAGDLAALQDRYRVEFTARHRVWRIHLTPKAAPLSEFLASVEMQGEGPALEQMAMREADGDLTVTRFQRVETDVRFTPEELARLFAPAGTAPAP
jgi:outer membrane lipoprotein-sorting protein